MILIKIKHKKTDLIALGKCMTEVTFRVTLDSPELTVTGYGNVKHKALENAMQKICHVLLWENKYQVA